MILLLDNYDSFTYNLAQYLGQMGQQLDVRRNDEITLDEIEEMAPERIVISPGPCTPKEAGISVPLIQRFAGKIPILGVCLGHQAIGAAFGGRVIRAPKLMHGKTSEIEHDGRTIFHGLPQSFHCHALSFVDRGTQIAAARAGNFGGDGGWDDYGFSASQIARGRRAVPSGIGADRRGIRFAEEFLECLIRHGGAQCARSEE